MSRRLMPAVLALASLASLPAPLALSAQAVPTPNEVLGVEIGADRVLADWPQITHYFARLAAASPAVHLDTLGPTTQGRPLVVAVISTPDNVGRLETIRRQQARLADPRGLSRAEEARLVAEQPAVVVIQCNIHSTEIASSQMAMELAHRLATNDTLQRALRDVIVVLIPSANPDGQQMVTEWYRQGVGTPHEGGPMPWLYHPYVGHDNNRDWYMVTQAETRLITDLLYRRWFPTVFYDVHQQGSYGMRLTVPPLVDPINPNVDPLVVRGIGHIGAEMSLALESAGKAGVGDGVTYDLWWHGGARSTPTRHNMVGLLTEAASARIASPLTIDSSELRGHARGLPTYERRVNFPNPWRGGVWRLRDIMDYELIAAEALVKMLGDQRETYVANHVALGRKAIALGERGGPYAYVLPAGQRDPAAVDRLVEVLRLGGVEVERATAPFTVAGRRMPAGSFVVPMAQPFRAHAKDLLEPQRFPKMERWPGGPPQPPYDVAGWTLPYQLGVEAIAVDSPFARPAARPVSGLAVASPAVCEGVHGAARGGLALEPRNSYGYRHLMRALAIGGQARITSAPARLSGGATLPAGSFVLDSRGARALAPLGCRPTDRVGSSPGGRVLTRPPRIAMYRPWTASMDEGWTRWVLEEFGVPYTSLVDSVVKAGKLRDHWDVILVPDVSLREMRDGMPARQVPAPYAGGLGEAGLSELERFVRDGGTLVLMDGSTEFATGVLKAPVTLVTASRPSSDSSGAADGRLPLYAPGSILRVLVTTSHAVAAGMPDTAAVYFTNSTTFDVPQGSAARVIARYPERAEDILLSGDLQGGEAIAGKAAAVEIPVGSGRAVLFGFRPQYRGQSYGTFKMLFNALLGAGDGAGGR
ncbi:MAG TPA: M14 family metallopeptidase [Gemmatimonadaceae bacterium]